MFRRNILLNHCLSVAVSLALCTSLLAGQSASATLRGKVTDELGGVIVKAAVTLVNESGARVTVNTDEEGNYVFRDIAPGKYTLQVVAKGFALSEIPDVDISATRANTLAVQLAVTIEKQEVNVAPKAQLSTDADSNAGAIVLSGADLDALPDDPDELAAALRMLAGPSAGPSGSQIYVDGFTGDGRLPSKSSIREVRINQNPFSAENDRLGFGRIEVTTRAGASDYHGQALFFFNDNRMNARNPFAARRSPFQARTFGGDFSGPIKRNRASFIAMFDYRERDDNAIINATILDPFLNIVPFSSAVLTPMRQYYFRVQADYDLNKDNSFAMQYINIPTSRENVGIGDFSLLSRAYDSSDNQHTFRFSERSIISQRMINQLAFQFAYTSTDVEGDNSVPTIRVLDAFTGGGAQVGIASNKNNRWDMIDHLTWTRGPHTLRAGVRLRRVHISDLSPFNFGGTFTFAGGLAPELNGNGQIVRDADEQAVLTNISSIERFRRTLLFQSQGRSPSEIRELGGGATQFSISAGDPKASLSQLEVGTFIQDDWRLRPNLTLSLGLRHEAQSNIDSKLDFAPRVAFAWSPGVARTSQPKMVIRGGAGIFFDRFNELLTLQARRFNGVAEQQFIISDPAVLDLFPQVPTLDALKEFAAPQTITLVAGDLRSPYTIQSSLSVERLLPLRTIFSATYINTRAIHVLRARNINAPLPGTFIPGDPDNGVRPLGEGNIYQYESSGIFKQHQLVITATSRINPRISVITTYALNKANSDTDGATTFPADTFDLSGEYGRSALDIRHRLAVSSTIALPRDIRLSPFIYVRSGAPYNITTGRDSNDDSLFTERPAFATDLSKRGLVATRFGLLDPDPGPGQVIIPRNFGDGPGFFAVNLALSKTLGFGQAPAKAAKAQPGAQQAAAAQARRIPAAERPYKLTLAVRVFNIFNHVNPGTPIGNLSSPFFGVSNATATEASFLNATSNRRVTLNMSFSF
jgi:hypothetical protein